MKTQLAEQQVQFYRDKGYLIVEDFLTMPELENWRKSTEEAVALRLSQTNVGILNNQRDDREEYYQKVFTQCLKLADIHDGMHEIMHNPKLGEMVAILAGVDGMRIWHDQALFKPPYGNPTAWHLDNPYWSFSSRDAISMWVALDDATLANGCMWYIPGSHKTATHDKNVGIGKTLGGLFNVYPEWLQIDPVAGPVPAGAAVFHNGLTAHGAGANMSNKPRRAMTCAFMPDGSTFNGEKNVLPDDYFKSLKIGDVIDDNVVAPLVWKK